MQWRTGKTLTRVIFIIIGALIVGTIFYVANASILIGAVFVAAIGLIVAF